MFNLVAAMTNHIFQILILDDPVNYDRFSSALQSNIASFRSTYGEAEYHLYEDQDIRDFLSDNFEQEVQAAYDALIPNAFKADLARYCLLYHFGGTYSDLSYLHIRSVELGRNDLVVFRDIAGHASWSTSNATLHARPHLPVFERAISRIVEHHRINYSGPHALSPTGPYMFGRVLAEVDDWGKTVFGDSRLISREPCGRANIAKILPNGEITAIRNKNVDTNISDLIGYKTDSYARLWKKGKVWRKNKSTFSLNKPFKR